jgi:hypothetical protein
MNAKEMFESLGYKYSKDHDDNEMIEYYKFDGTTIDFWIREREFIALEYGEDPKSITVDEFKAIQQQLKELGLLEEEKKTETNLEHYFEYLSKLNMSDFALIDGRVAQCLGTSCGKCDFNGDCVERKFKWLKQPYKKPIYKLSRFEYDLLRTNNLSHDKKLKDFATYENLREIGYFKDIDFDLTIDEILDNCEVIDNA